MKIVITWTFFVKKKTKEKREEGKISLFRLRLRETGPTRGAWRWCASWQHLMIELGSWKSREFGLHVVSTLCHGLLLQPSPPPWPPWRPPQLPQVTAFSIFSPLDPILSASSFYPSLHSKHSIHGNRSVNTVRHSMISLYLLKCSRYSPYLALVKTLVSGCWCAAALIW